MLGLFLLAGLLLGWGTGTAARGLKRRPRYRVQVGRFEVRRRSWWRGTRPIRGARAGTGRTPPPTRLRAVRRGAAGPSGARDLRTHGSGAFARLAAAAVDLPAA